MQTRISIITLLSYDYKYLEDCIKSYYEIADEIILGLDQNRISWSGNSFDFDMNFVQSIIKKIDLDKKIKIIESDFFKFSEPIQNDTYERNFLSHYCKDGNWIISIDVDERMVNANEFKYWLQQLDFSTDIRNYSIAAKWIQVFKIIEGQKILVNQYEPTIVGTFKKDNFITARMTAQNNVMSPLILEHYSWGRTREELWQKLSNWGHRKDFDIKKFFELWDSINLSNYSNFKNLHPLHGPTWPSLILDKRT